MTPHDSTSIRPHQRDAEHEEALEHVRAILRYIGEDPQREGLIDTPKRVVKSWAEHFSGYAEDPSDYLSRTFTEIDGYDQMVLLTGLDLHSHCEHHMVPFVGKAHVAYIPDGKVVGLSKLAKVVEIYSKRLQVQEKLTAQIANAIQSHLKPMGVAVVIQARHFCMCYRGVHQPHAWTTTSKLTGVFLEDNRTRSEFLRLIDIGRAPASGL
ncbi:MAG: GTP cyclohydrolase I FolE [Phycisphaerales bacterium]|nr:GTP cyclohydrolase I FolE [Phycisphaerales bacterium]